MRRLILLIFFNLLLIGLMLYLLDIYNFTNVYSTLKESIFGNSQDTSSLYSTEEIKLLEIEEHKKIMDAFKIREIELNKKEKAYKEKVKELERQEKQLLNDNKSLSEKKKKWLKEKTKDKEYKKQVEELATTFLNMPPQKAVERLIAIEDDLLIISILKEIEILCIKEERISIVPYLYSLMPKDDAARLFKKSTITP